MNALKNREYNPDAKSGRLPAACQRYGLGRSSLRMEAEKAGAIIKVGRSILVDYELMDKYFRNLAGK